MPATLEISKMQLPDSPPNAQPGGTVEKSPAATVRMPPLAEVSAPMIPRRAILDPLSFAPTIDPRLKIKKAFTVRFHGYESGMAAEAVEIEEFGNGTNSSEALVDLGKTIAELYFSLEAEADRLAPDLESLRAKLAGHIEQVRPVK